MLRKLALIPILLAIGCLFAGLYGAVHNQVSYTVSPEYFTAFKFHQFEISGVPHRIGAAAVGWMAAWWMGIIIGFVLIPCGLGLSTPKRFFWAEIRAFGVVTLTAIVVGLLGLAIGFLTIESDSLEPAVRYGNEIVHDMAFYRAGTMHNFSYMGGVIGIVTGCVSLYFEYRREDSESR